MEPITRRRAIQLGGLGLTSAVLGGAGLAMRWGDSDDDAGTAIDTGTGRGDDLSEPEVLSSRNGLLEVTFEAALGTHLVAGREATTLAYNGTVPGPTLKLRPGDRLRLKLVNKLDSGTNLHTHGLQVSPEGNSDNVFVHIDPGETFDYEYELGDDHPPGLFWYHPHLHGLVADQLFGGMYGAIIVEGDHGLPATRERVLIVGDTNLDGAGRLVPVSQMERMMGREGQLVTVNGQLEPVVRAKPGERERWQVVNACTSRFLSLRLEGQEVLLLGRDAIAFGAQRDLAGELLLAPGNRADLIVTATAGTSYLEAMPFDRGGEPGMGMGMGRGRMGGVGTDSSGSTTRVRLLRFEVAGAAAPSLPALPAPPRPRDLRSEQIAGKRELVFAMSMGGPGAMRFTIDGNEFDDERIDQEVRLDTVEEWTIRNDSPMDHPFHLHVWPMQVLEENGRVVDDTEYRDVVNVPSGGSVKVRIAFEKIGGKTVFHCHILDHEDLGMMGTIRAT